MTKFFKKNKKTIIAALISLIILIVGSLTISFVPTILLMLFIGILIICSFLTILYYRFKNKKDQHLIPQAFEKVND